jgi:hypothetical protein
LSEPPAFGRSKHLNFVSSSLKPSSFLLGVLSGLLELDDKGFPNRFLMPSSQLLESGFSFMALKIGRVVHDKNIPTPNFKGDQQPCRDFPCRLKKRD